MPEAIDTVKELTNSVKLRDKKNRDRIYYAKHLGELLARRKAHRLANRDEFLAKERARRARNHEKIRAQKRAWNEANRGKNNARMKAWRDANLEKSRAIDRARYAKNPQIKKTSSSAYYATNKEKLKAPRKAYGKARHKAHPEISRAYNAKRRAREFSATVGDTAAITAWESKWRRRKRVTCHWCLYPFPPQRCHVDHVIPLSKGGAHSLDNLVVACSGCNLSKSAKLPAEWNKQLTEPVLL